jgi:GTP-binding protein Era
MSMDDDNSPSTQAPQRCGLVAIVGRPNVGKSTLLNALVGQKISITSNKAQTTRHRITGIRTVEEAQFVFVDTPGFQVKHTAALNRTLNRTVLSSLGDVDVVLFVVEAGRFGLPDAKVLALLETEAMQGKPVLLVANKLDTSCAATTSCPARSAGTPSPIRADVGHAGRCQRLLGIVEPYRPELVVWRRRAQTAVNVSWPAS